MTANLRTVRLLTTAALRILLAHNARTLREEITMMRLQETFCLVPLPMDGDR